MNIFTICLSLILFFLLSISLMNFALIHIIFRISFTKYLFLFSSLYIILTFKFFIDKHISILFSGEKSLLIVNLSVQLVFYVLVFYFLFKLMSLLKPFSKAFAITMMAIGLTAGFGDYIINQPALASLYGNNIIHYTAMLGMSAFNFYSARVLLKGVDPAWDLSLQLLIRKIGKFIMFLYLPAIWCMALIQMAFFTFRFQIFMIDLFFIALYSIQSLSFLIKYIEKQKNSKRNAGLTSEFLESHNISTREQDVLTLVLTGLSNKEISEKLCISLSTTRTHISHIFEKTEVKSRMELLYKAVFYS